MPQLVSQELDAVQRRVQLRFFDCFGAEQRVSVSLLKGPALKDKIASTLLKMQADEDAVKAYAEAAGQDLSTQLAAGAEAIATSLADAAARGTTPPAAATTPKA